VLEQEQEQVPEQLTSAVSSRSVTLDMTDGRDCSDEISAAAAEDDEDDEELPEPEERGRLPDACRCFSYTYSRTSVSAWLISECDTQQKNRAGWDRGLL